MFGLILNLIISAIAVLLTAQLTPGVVIDSFTTSLILAVVLGFMNIVLKPILKILAFPINILSLGFFTLIINGVIVLLADKLVDGVFIPGLFVAIIFGIVLGVINGIFSIIKK